METATCPEHGVIAKKNQWGKFAHTLGQDATGKALWCNKTPQQMGVAVIAAQPSIINPVSPQSFERSMIDNSRQNSIIRQHSQEQAIRALELMFKVDPEEVSAEIKQTGLIKTIKAYTDMFDADAKSSMDE